MCLEVWTTFTLGKQPRAWHCLTIENVAVITAWLPTIAARVAIIKTGQNTGSARGNNGNDSVKIRILEIQTTVE